MFPLEQQLLDAILGRHSHSQNQTHFQIHSESNTFSNIFTESNTFSNTFTEACTFTESSAFTGSFSFHITFSHSSVLTRTLSVTETISVTLFVSCTVSLSVLDSSFTHVSTPLSYYAYRAVQYSSYYSFYSDFFTVIYQTESQNGFRIPAETLIGIVCGSIAAVLLIVGIVVFLVHRNSKQVLTSSSSKHELPCEREDQTEYVNQDELGKLALKEDDQWI